MPYGSVVDDAATSGINVDTTGGIWHLASGSLLRVSCPCVIDGNVICVLRVVLTVHVLLCGHSRRQGSDLFDPRLLKNVIKMVDVSYGGEAGFNQAIELSAETLGSVKLVQVCNLPKFGGLWFNVGQTGLGWGF